MLQSTVPHNRCIWSKKALQCFFSFTFIEHKNFWQNAKSKCVFLLSSVSTQYLHRWQRTDRGVLQCESWRAEQQGAPDQWQWPAAGSKGSSFLSDWIRSSRVCYTVVCWWFLLWDREPWQDVFLFFKHWKIHVALSPRKRWARWKNLLDVFFSDWIKWWTQREKCKAASVSLSHFWGIWTRGGLAHPPQMNFRSSDMGRKSFHVNLHKNRSHNCNSRQQKKLTWFFLYIFTLYFSRDSNICLRHLSLLFHYISELCEAKTVFFWSKNKTFGETGYNLHNTWKKSNTENLHYFFP